jgi:hypothetical protein
VNTLTPPSDRALRGIVVSNAITLALALWQQWTLLQLMWPFWMQSVIIGYYARRRMLALEEFSTDGLRMNKRPVPDTPAAKRKVANFFVLHYGGFHAAYLVFLFVFSTTADPAGFVAVTDESSGAVSQVFVGHTTVLDLVAYVALAVSFWLSHRASHHEHVAADLGGRPNLGTLMFMPYARVIPMHLTIIFGTQLEGGAVWLFVLLKTGADVVMHKVEHRVLQRLRAEVAQ